MSEAHWDAAFSLPHLKGALWGGGKVLHLWQKVFPKSNIYAMRSAALGIAHPLMGEERSLLSASSPNNSLSACLRN